MGRERGDQRRHSADSKHSSSRRRSSSSSRRQSALDRLGPKVPVVSRLGGGKMGRKRRRPGSKERSTEKSGDGKDNMQITIAGGQSAEAEGSSRKVARDVDMENFTVLDQVGEEDTVEKTESAEDGSSKVKTAKADQKVDLEKVVIKRREKEKKDDRKSTDGKDYVVKKPSSLISKLAKRKQQLSAVQGGDITEVTDQEISEIRKRCKAKYAEEEKVTEKVISMSLDLVHFAETQTYELIDSILQEELNEIKENGGGNATEEVPAATAAADGVTVQDSHLDSKVSAPVELNNVTSITPAPVASVDDGHDELDFEAEEPDKIE